VIRIGREQIVALSAVALMLLTCFVADGLLLVARSANSQELLVKRETVARLEARLRTRANSNGKSAGFVAPPAAFLTAATKALAGAQLQSYVASLAAAQQAVLVSASVETAHEDLSDAVHMQITIESSLKALQAILFQVESGTPYVFVEALSVVPQGAAAAGSIQDPRLHVTVHLRALWQKEAA
jgi:hypothetical protein